MLPLLLLLYYGSTVLATDQTVHLGYASYKGTPSSNGVSQWLGMRYAAPPTGNLRFAAPQDPPEESGVQAADTHGKLCLGTGDSPRNSATSEDCLFIDVYAPTSATTTSRLPVYFFIQGGGFNFNSNGNYDGSGLVAASGNGIVVVAFNYRVGPYGFLASREIQDAAPHASLNNGLKDQRKALEWVQKYIGQFGGDPSHVVLGGDSAGAASIAYHLTAYGGRDDRLFVAAAAESVSFATILNISESQYQYDNLVKLVGCAEEDNTLSCLRSKSATELQTFNRNIPYPGARNPPLYMWNPVVDGDMIRNYTRTSFNNGDFIQVPVIFGDDTNAGTIFTPRGTSSLSQSNTFLHNQFPYLTPEQLERISQLYPNEGPDFPNAGTWWRQVSNAYGDMRYMCPTLWISSTLARYGVKGNWNYRYNVEDPEQMQRGLGVPHTAELSAIWGPANTNGAAPASYQKGEGNDWIVPLMQSYWVSFIKTLDPNSLRAKGSPRWEEFMPTDAQDDSGSADWSRMLFDTAETTAMEDVGTAVRTRCQYLNSIGLAIRQ
ncbi:putative triacylglycerol lipase [Cladophialophora carrionii]|uniref:Carboxylic ester hydrolase n=1 Tax=Cladophialophora carrionii TaxID=86049 RepID=A0A1C1CWL6_9EURO|nr:putative triacylglycerol lipase [Cladophialophora carrionii]